MAWTNVSKPTGTGYTNVTFMGKQMYDDASVTYDSATTFYDTVNVSAWTDVAKPTGSLIIPSGTATGLIMPPTYALQRPVDSWTRVSKPT